MFKSLIIEWRWRRLAATVGLCIVEWSRVELQLSHIFAFTLKADQRMAYAVLGSVRSFDARLKMIGEAFNVAYRDADAPPRSDWKLLYNYCSSLNQLRNQIAHAIARMPDGEMPVLEPYFIMLTEKPHLSIAQVRERALQFRELSDALKWFWQDIHMPTEMKEAMPSPVPDLLLRLRAEAAQRRAKQQRPPRSSRP